MQHLAAVVDLSGMPPTTPPPQPPRSTCKPGSRPMTEAGIRRLLDVLALLEILPDHPEAATLAWAIVMGRPEEISADCSPVVHRLLCGTAAVLDSTS